MSLSSTVSSTGHIIFKSLAVLNDLQATEGLKVRPIGCSYSVIGELYQLFLIVMDIFWCVGWFSLYKYEFVEFKIHYA